VPAKDYRDGRKSDGKVGRLVEAGQFMPGVRGGQATRRSGIAKARGEADIRFDGS
jgi:hypothetical protein